MSFQVSHAEFGIVSKRMADNQSVAYTRTAAGFTFCMSQVVIFEGQW